MFNEKEIKTNKVENVNEKPIEEPKEIKEKVEKQPVKAAPQPRDYVVNVARLNVRSNPSDKAEIVKAVPKDTKVVVDISETKGAWSKITSPVNGYVMTKFIIPAK